MLRSRVNVALALANVIGAFVYVKEASQAWVNPEQGGSDNLAAEPIVWAVRAVPVFFAFNLINVIWGIAMLARVQGRSGQLYATVWLVWIIAIAVDFAHHG